MFKGKIIIFVMGFFVLLALECRKAVSEELKSGKVEKSVYTNKYFGFILKLPEDWSIQSEETSKEIMETGKEVVAGDNKNLQKALDKADEQSLFFFAAYKYPVGTPGKYNPNIIGMAEKISAVPDIKSGADYLFHARRLLEMSQMEVSFGKKITKEDIGGVEFDAMYVSLSFGRILIKQKYYAAIMKGYAVSFIISYIDEEGELSLENILATAKFE